MIDQTHFKQLGLPVLFAVIVISIVFISLTMRFGDARLDIADAAYRTGEAAKTIAAREQAFNQALGLYLAIDQEYHPTFGTGRLDYNIGNTLFQLGDYGRAMLYYKRAESLMPRDQHIKRNLEAVRTKLSLTKQPGTGVFSRLFFFHTMLSLPERLQLFFIFALLAFVCASLHLWKSNAGLKYITIVFSVPAAIMLLSLCYSYYFSPIEGVIIHSVDLRRDAGDQYEKVSKQPLPTGTEVEILSINPDNNWLKVLSPNGEFGYVPQDSIGLISP